MIRYLLLTWTTDLKKWIIDNLVKMLSDKFVLERYKKSGIALGATICDMHPEMGGQCDILDVLYRRKNFWGKECVRRGYKIFNLEELKWWGGWGKVPEGFGEKAS